MKNCGLTCPDCDGDIEYFDAVFEDDIRYENNYYCETCEEFKDDDRILR